MGCRCFLIAVYFCSITFGLDFEGLRYPRSVLLKQQSPKRYSTERVRRSADNAYRPREDDSHNPIYLNFDALKRTFHLRVWESWKHVFSDDFYVQSNSGCQTLAQLVGDGENKKISFLRGHLAGKKDKSVVYGYAKDGVFHGRIKDHERGTSYYVEDPSRFKKLINGSNSESEDEDDSLISGEDGVHSVIYEETPSPDDSSTNSSSEGDSGPRSHRKTSISNINNITTACAYQGATKDFMDDIQAHITSYSDQDFTEGNVRRQLQDRVRRSVSGAGSSDGTGGSSDSGAAGDIKIYPRNTCLISIISDHMFTKQFQDASVVSAEIANFVSELNNIFEDLVFDDNTKGYGFAIAKITIEDDSSLNRPDYKYKDPYIGVEKLLDLVSTEDHSQYCLAYLFTARDFMKGVLGLAWVAGDSAAGGICEAYKMHQNGERKSLNTGVITTINYGQQVAARVSHLTFTHEVGHNWGSPHDFPSSCKPGGERGNYIMFASATSADKPNNNRFSTCSIANMSHVLISRRDKCFKEADRAVCGNMVLDEDEVCDCGFEANCLASGDQCCWPAGSPGNKSCTLKPGSACSPSQGPCCTAQCEIVSEAEHKVCLEASECVEESYCDGLNVKCEPSKKDNLTDCNRHSQVCIDGVCVGSPCLKHSMVDCLCTEENYLCDLCCQKEGQPHTCQSSALLAQFAYNKQMRYIGSPCDAYNGYCDAFNRCMSIDSNGPLSRLKDAIFNPDVYKDIFQWARSHWWLTVLICLAGTIVFILFVKIFSVHTPSSNPNMPKNRHFRETVSTLPRTLRRTRRHAGGGGYSGGRPFTVSSAGPTGGGGSCSGVYVAQDADIPLRQMDHPHPSQPPRSSSGNNGRHRRRKPAGSSSSRDGRDMTGPSGGRNGGRGRNNRGPPPPDSNSNSNMYPHSSSISHYPPPPSRQHSSSAAAVPAPSDPFDLQPPPYYA